MTGYRDDRAALKKRNEELEDEVAALRSQLATRDEPDDQPAPLATGSAERPLPPGLLVAGYVAFVTLLWVTAGPVVGSELAVLLTVLAVVVSIVARLFVVPGPHEAVVVSGSANPPFRVARRPMVRLPLLHRTDRLDLTARLVPFVIDDAYTQGGVPVRVQGHAIVGIDPDEPGVKHAVARFLGRTDLEKVAAQVIEGAAREMVAELSPEMLSLDRLKASRTLEATAEDGMAKLGLMILELGIEAVDDGVGYLDALPRRRIAEALRDAERIAHDGGSA